jgi:hypothetical protein
MKNKKGFSISRVFPAIAHNFFICEQQKYNNMDNKELSIDYNVIVYSNYFHFMGSRFAFRKKMLFRIDGIPRYIPQSNQGWWIGKNLLTKTEAERLVRTEQVVVDVSDLQWYEQEQLRWCYNLE